MRNKLLLSSLAILLLLPLNFASAMPRDRSTLGGAIEVLDEMALAPEKSVPPALLRDASAVVIAPDVLKGGLVVAARHGHGVMLIREKNGGWSNPVFVTITGGSVGLQLGVQKSDIFLVIRNPRSLERIMRGAGKLTLGADASVAAGPLGRQVSADTDAMLRAEILSYSRSRGIFAGVALEGDTLCVDHFANEQVYGRRGVTVGEIVSGKAPAPQEAATLRAKLSQWTAPRIEVGPPLLAPSELPPQPPASLRPLPPIAPPPPAPALPLPPAPRQ